MGSFVFVRQAAIATEPAIQPPAETAVVGKATGAELVTVPVATALRLLALALTLTLTLTLALLRLLTLLSLPLALLLALSLLVLTLALTSGLLALTLALGLLTLLSCLPWLAGPARLLPLPWLPLAIARLLSLLRALARALLQ